MENKSKEVEQTAMTDYKALYEKEKKKKEQYCKVIKKQQQTIKELKEENKKPSLKQCLAEAMEENGSWMTHMKKDFEIQLRTKKEMVSMYSKENKKLKEEIKKLQEVNK